MTKLVHTAKFIFSKTLLYYLWQEFWVRCYFKFVLPKVHEITLEGLRLDVSKLSLKARNRLLNVGYERTEKEFCRAFLTPDDSVLEIGAAIGFIGLFCQKCIGIREYVLFEANPRTFEVLKQNYQLNGISPVAWNLALAPVNGRVELDVGADFWENSILEPIPGGYGRKTMEVPAATLSGLLEKAPKNVNVLIIDIEGAEQFVNWSEIPAQIDKVIIELHPHLIGAEATYNLIAALIAKGFNVIREEADTFAFLKSNQKQTRATLASRPFAEAAKRNGCAGRSPVPTRSPSLDQIEAETPAGQRS